MKKLLILLAFLIPILVNAQTQALGTGFNRVVAQNDFQIKATFYLGIKDTMFTPTQNGAIVTRPQDGKPYIWIGLWYALNYGISNIYPKNLLHNTNDSIFRLGGIADTTTVLNLENAQALTIDSAQAGSGHGFKVNFGSDAAWDLFMKDSATGYWTRIPAGTVGQVLTRSLTGGYNFSTPSAGVTNLGLGTATATTVPITSSTGIGVSLNSANHTNAGVMSAASKARLDSSLVLYNPSVLGDSLAFGSPTLDSLGFRRLLFHVGTGLILRDSSNQNQIFKYFGLDSNYVKTLISQNSLSGIVPVTTGGTGNSSFTAFGLIIGGTTSTGALGQISPGTSGQVLTSNGPGQAATMQNATAGFTNPMTTQGDAIYEGSSGPARLAGNITTTRQFWASLGTGSAANNPAYYTPGAADVIAWLAFTPENVSNKSNAALSTSATSYPTDGAVKTYVDAQATATLTLTNKTISGVSNTISNIAEGSFAFTNVTTANATISAHGLLPILPNNAALFLNGIGGYTAPVGQNIYNVDGSLPGARTMTLGSNQLKFTGGIVDIDASNFNVTGQTLFNGPVGAGLNLNNSIKDNGFTGSGGTRAAIAQMEIGQAAISASNTSVTFTKAASLYVDGPPTASTNVTITNPYSLYVASGNSYLGNDATVNGRLTINTIDSIGTATGGYVFRDPVTGLFKLTSNISNQILPNATQTLVNGSTSGNAIFSMPFQGTSYKKVIIYYSLLIGTAAYTFPIPFVHTPSQIVNDNGGTSSVTTTTGITMTGANATGFVILEGY